MKKYLFLFLAIPCLVWAEPLTITATEADLSTGPLQGRLARTCFYYCVCRNATTCTCADWKEAGSPHCIESDNGNGLDVLNQQFNVPIYEGDLPLTVRYTVTSVIDTGNETARGAASDTHTFLEPVP